MNYGGPNESGVQNTAVLSVLYFLLSPDLAAVPSRYALLHRADLMYPVEWYTYYDPLENDFGWVPFVARFEIDNGDFDFTPINFYTEPELSPWEIDLLPEIIDDVKERFPDEADIIVFCSASHDKEFCN